MERGALLSGGRDARAGFSCLFVVDILVPSAVPCPHQTKRAAGQIKEIMEDEPDMVGLRISVRTRGCSGNAFHLEYATEKNKFDEEIDAYVRGPRLRWACPSHLAFAEGVMRVRPREPRTPWRAHTHADSRLHCAPHRTACWCTSLSPSRSLLTSAQSLNLSISLRHGTKVWVDSKAIIKILGSTMDFVENDLTSEFVFENPNAKGACGCGESWHT